MKAKELRALSIEKINQELLGMYKEEFNLRLQKSINQLENPKKLNLVRKNIARAKTIVTEKMRLGND